eukprot:snap_masked-scaffold_6-processed-gene-10.17-mRNA-1 protein AED:1.00 eAED:1.00 QI:0/0/0/0/1/1/2/0/64
MLPDTIVPYLDIDVYLFLLRPCFISLINIISQCEIFQNSKVFVKVLSNVVLIIAQNTPKNLKYK